MCIAIPNTSHTVAEEKLRWTQTALVTWKITYLFLISYKLLATAGHDNKPLKITMPFNI